jgi:S-DNA-T family DNA segregation ATPase FtsK/SpoIIIE
LSSTPATKLTGTQRLLEAGLLFSCAFAFFLILALLSFDAADPSWSQTGYQAPVRNWGGPVGAYIADIVFFTFGAVAYSLPFGIAIIGWLLFQRIHHLLALDYLTLGLKIVGVILIYLAIPALASMNFTDLFYFSAGGVVGDLVSQSLITYFNFIGSSLLLLLLACAGFVFATGISFLTMIDFVGEKAIWLAMAFVNAPGYIQHRFGVNDKTVASQASATDDSNEISMLEDINAELVSSSVALSTKQEPTFSALDDEPFVAIDDIIEGPLTINVQEKVNGSEITAAFSEVEKINIGEDDESSQQAGNSLSNTGPGNTLTTLA